MILMTENQLRHLLQEWVQHYNAGRPHMAWGPGIPQPPSTFPYLSKHTGIKFHRTSAWWPVQSLTDCTMKIDLKGR
jgi:hypothetical protein